MALFTKIITQSLVVSRGYEMLFMIIQQMKEPWEENLAKAHEIEKKRQEKGQAFSLQNKMITTQYVSVGSSGKTFWLVDCEPELISMFEKAYASVLDIKAYPVITRAEWEKL